MIDVDVLTVLGPGREIHSHVLSALKDQGNVNINHHIIEGPPLPEEHTTDTIARARNRAKKVGTAHYAMFLDDDVLLPPRGIESLIFVLFFNPHYAALGIDYQGLDQTMSPWGTHVAMGSTLFVRPILEQIHFRTEPGKCECFCCCEDIRRMGYFIEYLPGLRADHLK